MFLLTDMTTIIPLAFAGIFVLLLLALGIALLCGKGGSWVSGYNFKAVGAKAVAQERILLKGVAVVIFCLIPGIAGIGLSVICGKAGTLVLWLGFGFSMLIVIIGLIWLNRAPKFKRAEYLARKYTENPNYVENEDDWKHPTKKVK